MRKIEDDLIVEGVEYKTDRNIKIGRFYCYLNSKTYNTLRGLLNNIRPMTAKDYYDAEYKVKGEGVCYCGKETSFLTILSGYREFCSDGCHSRSDRHRQIVSTRFENDPEKRELSNARRIKTMNEKPDSELQEMYTKANNTKKSRYGDNFRSDLTKIQWANRTLEQKKDLVDKANATKAKNGPYSNSGAFCRKSITINNKEFLFQGYEGIVIEMLINHFGILVDDILTGKDCPRIRYSGNLCQYHRPDIYIPSLNLYVEVKSCWTYWGRQDFLESNLQKQKAAIDSNHHHVIFVIKPTLTEKDILDFGEFLSTIISSQALISEKVQRLGDDSPYRSSAFGSGSAKHPKWMVI